MNKTEQILNDAFERIKNGTTINIPKSKKLSFSAVEDEAKVSRSLLRSYPELFSKIKAEILSNKIKKELDKPKNNNCNQNKLREELKAEKAKNKELEIKIDNLLKNNIGMAERINFLEKKLANK